MKSLLTTFLLLLVLLPLRAQQYVLDEVRGKYAEAQETIKQMKEELNANNSVTIKKHYIVSAIGPVEETIEAFFTDDANPEEDGVQNHYATFFVRSKCDARPTTMGLTCKEFLFDVETGQLIFYFKQQTTEYKEKPVTIEYRDYYDRDGLFCKGFIKVKSAETGKEIPAEDLESDGSEGLAEAEKLSPLLDQLMN